MSINSQPQDFLKTDCSISLAQKSIGRKIAAAFRRFLCTGAFALAVSLPGISYGQVAVANIPGSYSTLQEALDAYDGTQDNITYQLNADQAPAAQMTHRAASGAYAIDFSGMSGSKSISFVGGGSDVELTTDSAYADNTRLLNFYNSNYGTNSITISLRDIAFNGGDRAVNYGYSFGSSAIQGFDTLNLTNISLIDNTTSNANEAGAGGLYIANGKTVTVNDLAASGNNSTQTGTSISGAVASGAGVRFDNIGNLLIDGDSTNSGTRKIITVNHATAEAVNGEVGGGGMTIFQGAASDAENTIKNQVIFLNRAVGDFSDTNNFNSIVRGGGILVYSDDTNVNFGYTGTSFENVHLYANLATTGDIDSNFADGGYGNAYGGGVAFFGNLGTISFDADSVIEQNWVMSYAGNAAGGGVYLNNSVSNSGTPSGTDTVLNFNGTHVYFNIAGAYNELPTAGNSANSFGGGISIEANTFGGIPGSASGKLVLNLNGAIIEDNVAGAASTSTSTRGNAFGGGLSINEADSNGMVYTYIGGGTIFDYNAANSFEGNADGGAIWSNTKLEGENGEAISAIFTQNNASAQETASGGAVSLNNYGITDRSVATSFINSEFTENIADSHDGTALGGAISFLSTEMGDALTLINTSFTDNKALTDTGDAKGGAIYTDSTLNIVANGSDVVFSGNRATIIDDTVGSAYGNSIYSTAGVNYYAIGADDRIEDYDGINVQGTVRKDGLGTLALLGDSQHRVGELIITSGTLESSFYYAGNGFNHSGIYLDSSNGGSGRLIFGSNATWSIDFSGVELASFTRFGTMISRDAWNEDDRVAAMNAILRGSEEMAVYGIVLENIIGGAGIRGILHERAQMSDIRNSAMLMHRANTIRMATNARIDQNRWYYNNSLDTQANRNSCMVVDPCAALNPCKKIGCGPGYGIGLKDSSVWVNYVGRYGELNSTYYDDKIEMSSSGVQLGLDLYGSPYGQFGLLFGYEDQKNRLYKDRIDANDYYFGLYTSKSCYNGLDIRGMVGYGFQDYDMIRYPEYGTVNRYNTSFDGNTFEANIEIGRRFMLARNLSFRPSFGLDYFNNELDGTDEGGPGIVYSETTLSQLFMRAGTDLRLDTGCSNFHAGIFYSYQCLDNGNTVDSRVSQLFAGTRTSTILGSSDLGHSIISVSFGGDCALNSAKTLSVFANYYGDIYVDRDDTPLYHSGMFGMRWRF